MTSTSSSLRPTSLFGKAFWLLRYRPLHFMSALRGMALFYLTTALRAVLPPLGVEIGRNVRLQKLRCVSAEAPEARIVLGDDSIIYENARIDAFGKGLVELGAQSILGDIKIVSRYRISIGKRFLSSWNVFIQDYDPHPVDAPLRARQVFDMVKNFRPSFRTFAEGEAPASKLDGIRANWNFPGEEIRIGDDVWVGANVTILKGARIGDGCIVATGAVVLRGEYPPASVLAGNPAKVVRSLSSAQ